jgi:four helix bundle protein
VPLGASLAAVRRSPFAVRALRRSEPARLSRLTPCYLDRPDGTINNLAGFSEVFANGHGNADEESEIRVKEKTPRHFRNLEAWSAAMDAALACYALVRRLPAEERFELGPQMRRAAVSVPANVAEGHSYGTDPMLAKHLRTALGSLGELQTQIELTVRLKYFTEQDVRAATNDLIRTAQLLRGLLRSIQPSSITGT